MERSLDPTQDNVERYAGLLPGFHQSPIDRTQKKMLSSSSNKCVFNFSKVVEVIHLRCALSLELCALCLEGLLVGKEALILDESTKIKAQSSLLSCPLINQSQSFQRQGVINLLNILRARGYKRRKTASGDDRRFASHLFNYFFQYSVNQTCVTVIKSRLHGCHR